MLLNGIPLNYLIRWLGHGRIQTTLVYLELAPESLGKSGIGAMIHTLGVGWEDAIPAVTGDIAVGHQTPPVAEVALANVLDRFVNTI